MIHYLLFLLIILGVIIWICIQVALGEKKKTFLWWYCIFMIATCFATFTMVGVYMWSLVFGLINQLNVYLNG